MAKKVASDLMKRLEIKKDNLKIFTDKYLKEMMKKIMNFIMLELLMYHIDMKKCM